MNFKKILPFIFLIVSLIPAAANAGFPFYSVSNGEKTIFLLGSIHVLDKIDYPINKKIIESYQASDSISFETVDSYFSETGLPVARKLLALKNNESCEGYVGKELFQEGLSIVYPDVSSANKSVLNLVLNSHPYLLTQLIQYSSTLPFQGTLAPGVEQYFLKLARSDKKEIGELEGVANNTIKFLDLLSREDSALMLKNVIAFYRSTKLKEQILEKASEIMGIYRQSGDVEKIRELDLETCSAIMGNPNKFCSDIFEARNGTMARKIGTYFSDKQQHFVILGAAHLGGKNNVLDSLEKSGFTITRIDTTAK